ncbi:MAG: glycosyltransferase family 2 protein [Cyanobacteria bacterium]|nr:glycosyltransferase family 2 protein [Cyanobacteriota bacterium]
MGNGNTFSMIHKSFFSVVIPSCNRPELLSRCLNRLIPGVQTISPELYEVIVTDDSSNSSTKTLVTSEFAFARWVQGPRRGRPANRNNGARLAKGNYIAFVDDDCVPDLGWLEAFAKCADEGLPVLEGRTTTDYPIRYPFYEAPINETGGLLWSCNFMIDTRVFSQLGGFDENFVRDTEDIDLRERIVKAGLEPKFVSSALVVHPQRRVRSVIESVLMRESVFYYCKKHSVPLRQCGGTLDIIAKGRVRTLLASKSGAEAVLYSIRIVAEMLFLLFLYPVWFVKYMFYQSRV